MENASKALIIAGAILLSILIIGLGMYIYTQASSSMSGANLDPQKVSAYNSEFEQYEGTRSGTEVRALLDTVRSHNNANVDDATLNIAVMAIGTSAAACTSAPAATIPAASVNAIKAQVSAGSTYTVDFGYDANSGYIVCVGIVKKN